MFVTGGLQNRQNAKEFGDHDLVHTIHRYSRFLALLGEKWGCVLYMGAYSTWGKTVYALQFFCIPITKHLKLLQ